MADNSTIEWTDATWNPITGCSVVSPGCSNCYAMRLAGTRLKHHPSRSGLTIESRAGPVWNGEVRFNEQWLFQPLRWRRPRKIFVCAHGDLFHESVPDVWIDRVFAVMALAPQHMFQILTKRAARMREYLTEARAHPVGMEAMFKVLSTSSKSKLGSGILLTGDIPHLKVWPLPKVWLGVSVENQAFANERIPDLLATPAAVRFVSAEPLIRPINLRRIRITPNHHTIIDALDGYAVPGSSENPRLSWVIVGGESGPGARPMHPDWARSIRDQCADANVPFFMKQWGEWAPNVGAVDGWQIEDNPEISRFDHREWIDGRWSEPFRPMWCDWVDGNIDAENCVSRIGKKRAGRLLDGVEHNGMPEARP